MRIELRTSTAEQTRAVGEGLASLVRSGDALALTGELGAGKTTLVQGIARGLGVEEQVVSPTFTLVREYLGRLHLYHVDVYRLDRVQDAIDLGLEEMSEPDSLLVVEWGDAIETLLPEDHLVVELTTPDPASEERRLVLASRGQSWTARTENLEAALAPWMVAAA